MPMANRALLAILLLAAPLALAQQERDFVSRICPRDCESGWQSPPLTERRYSELDASHRLNGLASYYSTFFDGRKTANGEIYRNRKYSAAHLTLPLGSWIEVTARATGRKLRLRVNDRGPYAKKFCLDLSQAAARFLGVDKADDRHIEAHVIALPGEEPPPEPAVTLASATRPGQ
jgi:rare lipoprotein A